MNDSSRLCQETEKLLQCLHDSQARLHATADLDWSLENGDAFQLEEVGTITSKLLKMALEETDNEAREDLLCLVDTAEQYNPIREYLDYETLADRMTSFPSLHGLDFAISILGTSRQLAYISLLETFLAHERLSIRLLAMDAITQIWLEVSDNDLHVQQQVNRDAARHLWLLVNNPQRQTVSGGEMEQLIQTYCDEVIHNLHTWLAIQEKS